MSARWITVAAFQNELEAHVARTKLESEGIDAVLADDTTMRMYASLGSTALGGVKLRVKPEDEQRAREILSSEVSSAELLEAEAEAEGGGFPCPKCRSTDTIEDKFLRPLGFIASFFLGAPWPKTRTRRKCISCGHRWG